MANTTSEVRLTLRVHTPFWLPALMWCATQTLGVAAVFGWTLSDQRIERLGAWYARRLRITALAA